MQTPIFLTREMAWTAVDAAVTMVLQSSNDLSRLLKPRIEQLHVVVVVPARMTAPASEPWMLDTPPPPLVPHVLYEHRFGFGEDFDRTRPIDKIAHSKVLQLWEGRNDDRTDCMPHLLFQGEAPKWGAAERDGILVACSGEFPWIDKLIARMIVDMMIAMARSAWENSGDKAQNSNFITG